MVTNSINIQVPLSVLKPFSMAREIKVPLNSPPIKSLSRSPLVHRVNAGVNFNVQQRGHSQGRCTVSCAASSPEGWEHADLENRCLGRFRLCRNTFDMHRVHHHTGNDSQSMQANRLLVSKAEPHLKPPRIFTAPRTHKCLCLKTEELARGTPLVQPVHLMLLILRY